MGITEKDIKLLWGRAAGFCSHPECNENLTRNYESGYITLGEMAHVIARSENGPRGSEIYLNKSKDTYENLILLCPTHHRNIDKAPKEFSVAQILDWKKNHEKKVENALSEVSIETFEMLCNKVSEILLDNNQVYKQYGPDSLVANHNPFSEVAEIWDLKKHTTIIPNNKKIINLISNNIALLNYTQKLIFYRFKEHAQAFEMNSQTRLDLQAVPRFPIEFSQMIEEGSK
ncbi:HNH endonuclease signature motif containing protein [Anaerobacillus sp. 1_MG-2023]|uniref:HNH endonuclease signature motif containing protein n=1 Tax=Anaerobacillus sp. 1_MG-2023 TaxID=3062655 RepID=UPI0026E12675|nr:HNH endonuclease signature motif containing protein [Anaerobacillus sp. 1_MG-2023]MDO6658003.1 HNH endonuclease signature motif containing protein [Anaerobacillus sp. 1_MG-2023]